jgi:hypothetical protein
MGDRLLEQLETGKTMADGLLQGVELHALRLVTGGGRLKSMSRLTLPNSLTLREYSMDMTMRPSSLVMSRSEAVMVVTSSTMARLVKALRSSETVGRGGAPRPHRALDALGDHRDQLEPDQQQGREHGRPIITPIRLRPD